MRKLIPLCAAVALVALPVACELTTQGNPSAKNVLVATLLSTPPIEISPEAMAGIDGGFDAAGFPVDAGFSFDAGRLTLPPVTVAFAFFGSRSSESLDVAPTGDAKANVFLAPAGGTSIAMKNDGNGNFSKSSLEDSTFSYEAGKTYDFTADLGGEAFVGEIVQVPQIEKINQFHPAKGFVDQITNTAFTFTRPDPPTGQERPLGFVTVFPVSENGDKGQPSYTNVPTTPLQFLKLVALPSDWKATSVTIPGTAFPATNKTYLVIFQSVKLGGPKTQNLFTGSAILGGTADIGVFRTK